MSRPLQTRPLNIRATLLPCPCGKQRGRTLNEAKKLRRRAADRHGNYNPVRYYECTWGNWHWTSILETVDADGKPWQTAAEIRLSEGSQNA